MPVFDTWGRDQLTEAEAIEFGLARKFEGMSDFEIVDFQLFQERLAVPWHVFHSAVERVFGRPVYFHEFADQLSLAAEFRRVTNGKAEVLPPASPAKGE